MLKYKVTITEGEHMEPLQEHIDHLEMEPSAYEDAPLADDDLADVQGPSKKIKNQKNLFNRSSPMKIVRVCKAMTNEQRIVIRNAYFGGMLGMKVSKLIPELCRFLMGCFNPKTCELDFGDRGKIPITIESVVRVMGVPGGGSPVPYHLDVNSTCLILEMFGIHNGKQPTVAFIEKLLGPTYPASPDYLRKFIIYSVSSTFTPNTGTLVSPRCYPSVINTDAIRHLNWARFIIDVIIQTANAKDTKNWFKACMTYLMVLYVDSLDTDALKVPENGTRICIWTNKMVRCVIDLDTNSDGSFGKLPLNQRYRIRLSLFSAEPFDIDMFIKRHVVGDHSDEDLVQYRTAVIEMCNIFEDGLAKFLRLSNKENKGLIPEQKENFMEQHLQQDVQ